MTKLQLMKHNSDLRTRLENAATKMEIERIELHEERGNLHRAIQAKDKDIRMLQREIATLTEINASQAEEIASLREELDQARDLADRYRAICAKDSTTSSKPPTTDEYRKPQVFSTRQPSGRKPGGQAGHRGHTLKLFENPTQIIERRPLEQCTCGGAVECIEPYTAKQQADILIVPVIIEERGYTGYCAQCGRKHSGVFSPGFVNPVQYGPGLKAIIASMNAYANVTNHKVAEFLKSVTGGLIQISEGTVVNTIHELSCELEETISAIRAHLIAGKLLHADETGCRVNGQLDWMQIYSNEGYTLFSHNEKRGDLCVEDDKLLLFFTGVLVHDHFSSYYKYTHFTHAECNVHILRYLEAVIKIQQHAWAQEMASFLRSTLHLKKVSVDAGQSSFQEEQVHEIRRRYFEILDMGQTEYDAAVAGKNNISYFNDERCLLKRLRDYADQHLLFIEDFGVPFDNNNAEQGARFLKSKKKVSGGFRSDKGARDYARVASAILSARKQKFNIFQTIRNLFLGIPPPFVAPSLPSSE